MDTRLSPIERRVLGVLVEKALSGPDYYPMTVGQVVAGCNQKSNRDPVMELDELTVTRTLEELRRRGLVQQVLPAPGARADRYKHLAGSVFGWGPKDCAVMAELLLRGPQSVGELRTRCARMYAFDSPEHVANVLEDLAGRTPPMVRALPRESGRTHVRFAHTLYLEGEEPAPAGGPATAAPPSGQAAPAGKPGRPVAPAFEDLAALASRVDALADRLDEVLRRVEALEARRADPGP